MTWLSTIDFIADVRRHESYHLCCKLLIYTVSYSFAVLQRVLKVKDDLLVLPRSF